MPSKHEADPDQGNLDSPSRETGKETVFEYYERYLRKKHPELSDREIKRRVEFNMSDEFFKELIEGNMSADENIRKQHPQMRWTTPFEYDWVAWSEYIDSLLFQKPD